MRFYEKSGFVLVALWLVTFIFNWGALGGDPFSLVFLELGMTLVWVVWMAAKSRSR